MEIKRRCRLAVLASAAALAGLLRATLLRVALLRVALFSVSVRRVSIVGVFVLNIFVLGVSLVCVSLPGRAEKADVCRDPGADPLLVVPACTKQIDKAPQDRKVPALLNARGIAKFRLGDYEGALDDFNKALDRDPQDAAAYKNRGLTRQQLGDLDGAVASFNQALKLKRSPDFLNARGAALFGKGEYASAAADFTAAVGLDPGFAKAYLNRGLAFHFLRRFVEAKADFDTFIRLQPSNPLGFNDRAALFEDQDKVDEAIADYTTAIALSPGTWEGYSHRGEAWRLKGDLGKALEDHDRALAISQTVDAYNNRVLVWKDKGDLQKAIADCDQAILLDPKRSLAFANRGELERLTGASGQALIDLDKAVALEPHSPIALTFRGDLFRANRSFGTAVADYNKALSYVPDFVAAYVGRGLALEAQGKLAEARADFEKALDLPAAIDARLAKPAQALAADRLDSLNKTDADRRKAAEQTLLQAKAEEEKAKEDKGREDRAREATTREEKARAQGGGLPEKDGLLPHQDAAALEDKAWDETKTSKDPEKFRAFVRAFPHSRYISVAQDWIDLLVQAEANRQAANEAAVRAQAVKDQAAREKLAREQAARDQAAKETAARETAAKEALAKEMAAKEMAAKEAAAKEAAAKEAAAKEAAAKEAAAKEAAAKEAAAKEAAAKEAAAKEAAAKEAAAKDMAAKEAATKELAAKDQAARERLAREQAAKEQASKEQAAKAQFARDRLAQDSRAPDTDPPLHKSKVALVIGNAKYGGMALATADSDANAIADGLERLDFKVIRRFDVNWAEFDGALTRFEEESAGASVALFYFSGHAMHFGTQSYLMPIGAKLDGRHSIDFKMISLEDDIIRTALADVPCKVVILDAARRNAVADRFATEFGAHHDPADGMGLAPLPMTGGLLIASSAPARTLVSDGQGASSPYTTALLHELDSPTADLRDKLDAAKIAMQKDTKSLDAPPVAIAADWQRLACTAR